MGQITSRHHRPEDPLSLQPVPSSGQSSSTRIADSSSLTRSQRQPNSRFHSSHHNSDLSHQSPLPPKRSNRRSFLGSLRSPLRSCLNPQRQPSPQPDIDRPSNTHKRWPLDRRRRKRTELASTLPDFPEPDESQPGEPPYAHMTSASASSISPPDAATTNQKGKAKLDRAPPSPTPTDHPSPVTVGPSSSDSSTMDVSQSDSVPFQSTATDISSPSSSAPSSASSLSPPRGLLTLNHDPAPLSTPSIDPDNTPPRTTHTSEAFNVMERPATPPEPSQPPPLPEARRNFPAAGTLVVVQGVVHTSDVSQSASPEPSETMPRRASSVPPPPPGERPSRRRLSDLLVPMRERRSSYVAPESQSSETSPSVESENQEEFSLVSEMPQDSATQEEPPVPASRPLSLSPTSIDVLGTLLSVATAATAASLVSGSSEPLLNSGLAPLPYAPGAQGSQQPSQQPPLPPITDQAQSQNISQGQSRPLSPTPTAGLASRDRVRNAWAGLRDRLGFRPSSPTTSSPVSPSAPSPLLPSAPPPEPEPAPNTSPVTPVDPRTQLLADMARAFQMGMGVDDGSGSGSRSGAPSSPAIEVNLGDGQHRQQQERSPPPEDSFERFLLDLQVDLRRTLEDGQPDAESEQEPEQEQDVDPVGADAPPLVYPREAPLSTRDRQSAPDILDFGESLPALPLDDDDLLPNHPEADASAPDIGDDGLLEEPSAPPAPAPPPSQPQTQTRRTVVGSERRPGGGINWWRMYRFPPMVVSNGAPSTVPSPASPAPPPAMTPPASVEASTPPADRGPASLPTIDTQAQAQDGNTVVPVIVVGLQSVHGYGHGHGHRHADERDERTSQQQQQEQQQQQRQQESGQDNDHSPQDDTLDESAESSPRGGERRWSSRATDALQGLRPVHGSGSTRRERSGSSSSEGDARAGDDMHGSTTFFIYVIGGYYPPNHQLVTGTDPLDSFEELAELLGQAKPQTASKEDIDNSGLELIRMGALAEYEKSGRVAPMCVDRCLICLEDYDPEEDLRLLSCRHVFHKECVDRWLETGRNNCPACRSQGVTSSGPVPVPSAA